jgi:hypothetical protein
MRLFEGSGRKEIWETLRDHEKRLPEVETEAKSSADYRAKRRQSRETWLTKVIPAAAAVITAFGVLSGIFHWI